METEATIKLISGVLLTMIIGFTYLYFKPLLLDQVVVAYVISIVVQLFVSVYFLYKRSIIKWADIRMSLYDPQYMIVLWKSCLYLGLTQLFMYGYFQADQIIMRFYHMDYELGIYSAMYRIVQLLFFVTNTLLFAYMPHMLKSDGNDNKKFDGMMLGLRFVLFVVFILFGKFIISLMYTDEYISGYWILIIQLVGLYFMMQNMTTQQKVLARHKEHSLVMIFAIGLFLNVVGNIIVIPMWGVYGAAGMSLLTQIIIFGILPQK